MRTVSWTDAAELLCCHVDRRGDTGATRIQQLVGVYMLTSALQVSEEVRSPEGRLFRWGRGPREGEGPGRSVWRMIRGQLKVGTHE